MTLSITAKVAGQDQGFVKTTRSNDFEAVEQLRLAGRSRHDDWRGEHIDRTLVREGEAAAEPAGEFAFNFGTVMHKYAPNTERELGFGIVVRLRIDGTSTR